MEDQTPREGTMERGTQRERERQRGRETVCMRGGHRCAYRVREEKWRTETGEDETGCWEKERGS